ncbi:MAG: hypothetical protein LC794_01595 [Acidobacteria bacterium]|nr:hypothetical protein [Acidobacteriota bacterium]
MRSWFYAFGLASALVFGLAEQAVVPNFAGTWTLDKNKSQDLQPSYRSFERVSWVITQTDNEISIQAKYGDFVRKDLPPVRPGRGAGGVPIGPRTYKLDGRETTVDIGGTKFTRKATLSNDGKTLELVEKETFHQGTDDESTRTSTDKLSLSADGKVLTVIRHRAGWPAPQDSTLVFNK